ncbi:NAD(P)/FAD-dependent oxidoreductase [Mesorhizobium sp. 1B3]|uniref:FAD/NAD(P)-dependent oxidoreductase n=1 Tax=Mesorhizobium sp. 1B3 TaxID=3243599 RepID=UPI003D959F83
MSNAPVDVAIVGAGPAGMAAAAAARELGLSVALFDEQPTPGGQIYRNVMAIGDGLRAEILGKEYLAGRPLAQRFLSSGAAYFPSSTVWRLAEDGISWTSPAGGGECAARRVLIATGAMERPFPVRGWTLPGVMTAGAAQILLKSTGTVADDAVFVGAGPLLYLIVCQYLQAGVRVRAVLDTADPSNRWQALRHLPVALTAPGYLAKGLKLLAQIRRSGVPHHRGVRNVAFAGDGKLSAVTWADRDGTHQLECAHAFVHQGIIPNVNMTMAAGGKHRWDTGQLCWRPELDDHGRTSKDWLIVAGDGGGIAGARSAALSGEIAALAAAVDLGRIDGAEHARRSLPLLATRRRDQAVRPFLERLYRPTDALRIPQCDEVVVCRCEEVRKRDVWAAVAEDCAGPNQLKSFTRAGMGPCQGRMCGHTVVETMAAQRAVSPTEIGYYRIRMPVKPVTVGEIAGLGRNEGGITQ